MATLGQRDVLALEPDGSTDQLIRRSSGEQAAVYIRRLIFDGGLRPGERIPQEQIAATLGISRIPVREALIALEREGWVTIQMHRGAFVSALDEQAVRDTYELFGLVYGFAVRRAIGRGEPDLVDRLREISRRLSATDDPGEVGRLTLAFHGVVVDSAASPRVRVLLRAMSGLVPGNFFELVPGAIDIEKKGLTAVTRAVVNRDADKARVAYERTMHRQGELVVQLFADRGLFEEPTP
ncbi:MAG: GntR family transcriptional regulator [Acidimicrobiia bacterium]